MPWYNNQNSIKRIVIEPSVIIIGDFAFSACKNLTMVIIPDSVTAIEESAFSWCTGLTTVTIPNSVTTIGYDAFYSCGSLQSVTIPAGMETIEINAFSYCGNLKTVYHKGTQEEWGAIRILDGNDALYLLRHTLFPERYPLYSVKNKSE